MEEKVGGKMSKLEDGNIIQGKDGKEWREEGMEEGGAASTNSLAQSGRETGGEGEGRGKI